MGDPVEATSSHPGFAWPWGIYRWIDGDAVTLAGLADPLHDAAVLASFLRALQAIDPTGGTAPGPHNSGRGLPLAGRDARTRACIGEMHGMISTDAVTASWEASLEVPAWSGPPRWVHGDIHQGNLLMARGGSRVATPRLTRKSPRDGAALSAVIDFGCLGGMDLGEFSLKDGQAVEKVFHDAGSHPRGAALGKKGNFGHAPIVRKAVQTASGGGDGARSRVPAM